MEKMKGKGNNLESQIRKQLKSASTTNRSSNINSKYKQALKTIGQGLYDNIDQMIRHRPSQFQNVVDHLHHKFPQDAAVFGKPQVIINSKADDYGQLINQTLCSYTVQELIDLAEEFSSSMEPALLKILEKIEKQRDQKEY